MLPVEAIYRLLLTSWGIVNLGIQISCINSYSEHFKLNTDKYLYINLNSVEKIIPQKDDAELDPYNSLKYPPDQT
jgi:hypothetical protein